MSDELTDWNTYCDWKDCNNVIPEFRGHEIINFWQCCPERTLVCNDCYEREAWKNDCMLIYPSKDMTHAEWVEFRDLTKRTIERWLGNDD